MKKIEPVGITDDIRSSKSFGIATYSGLCLIAIVMTVMNIFTDKGILTYLTAGFAVLCAIDLLLTILFPNATGFTKALFAVEVLFLFLFFLVTGNPDGFSAIWICMLPSVGMFFFGRERGSVLCAVMFLSMVFLLWTDLGSGLLLYPYNQTFRMRFPILFVAFHLVAFLLETLRTNAYKEMKRMEAHYQDLSIHDPLTGVLNRQGLYSELDDRIEQGVPSWIGVALFDLDFFKNINDTHGHIAGDNVLCVFSKVLTDQLPESVVCRWGGEEFVVIFANHSSSLSDLEAVLEQMRRRIFRENGAEFRVTVSGGYAEAEIKRENVHSDIETLIRNADAALYRAKDEGRDRLICYKSLTIAE